MLEAFAFDFDLTDFLTADFEGLGMDCPDFFWAVFLLEYGKRTGHRLMATAATSFVFNRLEKIRAQLREQQMERELELLLSLRSLRARISDAVARGSPFQSVRRR